MIPPAEQEGYNQLTAWTLSLRDREFIHQHVVDVWALQHADEHSKAIAAPFTLLGMYLHLEKGYTGKEVQIAHMLLGQPHGRGPGRKQWPRFALPKDRGRMTVLDVMAVPESERKKAIDRWCRSVWDACRDIQQQVRDWLQEELDEAEVKRRATEWEKKFSARS
jgi:hypothetical protein